MSLVSEARLTRLRARRSQKGEAVEPRGMMTRRSEEDVRRAGAYTRGTCFHSVPFGFVLEKGKAALAAGRASKCAVGKVEIYTVTLTLYPLGHLGLTLFFSPELV